MKPVTKVARQCMSADHFNSFVEKTLGKLVDYLRIQRNADRDHQLTAAFEQLAPSRTVCSGPFKGIRYPELKAFGSTLYPKLLGSYESELHPTISRFASRPYETIHDIGCAEGYYAVGLSKLFPRAKIYAYDLDPAARAFCERMASANNVHNPILPLGFCDPAKLSNSCTNKRDLIVCDCEGFEEHLFTPEFAVGYSNSDLIIEIHDFISPGIGKACAESLQASHKLSYVSAEDTESKVAYFSRNRERFPKWIQKELVSENRPSGMYWLIAESKKTTAHP